MRRSVPTKPSRGSAGSFAERVVVRAADVNLVRLPDELDFVGAAALGCRFATAFRALTAYRRVERKTGWWCSDAVVSAWRS